MAEPVPRIRSVRRSELPAILDLLDICFDTTERRVFEEQTYHDSTFRLNDGVVAEGSDGWPVSFVRIFRRTMLLRGVEVPLGGIGSVSTHPDWRHNSLATAVLRECIGRMRRRGYALSFLYTGIIEFYERLGWRVVPTPLTTILTEDAASLPGGGFRVRPLAPADMPAVMQLHEADTRGRTGAVVRTEQYWRDHMRWSDDGPDGFLVACRGGGPPAAYVRGHGRIPVIHYLLEAVAPPGEGAAMAALLGQIGREAAARSCKLIGGMVPEDSTASDVLTGLSSHRRLFDVRIPDMVMLVSARAALEPLLPALSAAAAAHPGPSLRAEIGDAILLVSDRDAALTSGPQPEVDAWLRFDPHDAVFLLTGQRSAGECVADARGLVDAAIDRLDAVFPRTAFHFWHADRI